MKATKGLLVLGLIFGISYSCSTHKAPLPNRNPVTIEPITKVVVVGEDTKVLPTNTNDSKNIDSYFYEAFEAYKQENLRLGLEIKGFKFFMDSLVNQNKEMYELNNKLLFDQMVAYNKEQNNKHKLLLEKERNLQLHKKVEDAQTETKEGERYMSIFLSTGITINLLMTIWLFYYKRKSVRQLKKLNLIHA